MLDGPAQPRSWIPTRDTLARASASALSGNLMWMAAPDLNWWWLSFIAWIPWLWSIRDLGPKRAFMIGWISGLFSVFVGFFWMTELLTRFAGFPIAAAIPIHLLFAGFQGLQWAIPAALLAWLQRRTGRSTLLLAPLLWAGCEAILPNIFPVYMGFLWAWQPVLIQLAEIGGALTVTLAMVGMNAALYELATGLMRIRSFRGTHRRAMFATLIWFIGVPTYGIIRMAQVDAQIDTAPKMKVAVVQGNFGIRTYSTPGLKPRILRELQLQTKKLQDKGAELAVWGETAYPFSVFFRDSRSDLKKTHPRRVQRHFDIPLIFGTTTRERKRKTNARQHPWNSALVMHRDGKLGDLDGVGETIRWEHSRYDKNHPLYFGEAVPPPIDPDWYLDLIPSASHLNVGEGPNVLEANGYRFGPLICYEDILPRFARDIADEDIHAFVNLTNDSWFGNSPAQGEHLGLSVFRAVEHRKALIRSVNAGASAHIDPAGRVITRTDVTDSDQDGYRGAEGFVADVAMMDPKSRTLYGRFGNLFALLIWLTIATIAWRKRPSAR